ncbi:MAG TPA: hypothetical protein VGL09_06800 [Methylomirabilota bacterium]|jgi:hypothetical protein
MRRLRRATLLLGIAVLTGACATAEEWRVWNSNSAHFASGQHGLFSLRNQDEAKRVTRADIQAAGTESWWGRAVAVSSAQIIEQ